MQDGDLDKIIFKYDIILATLFVSPFIVRIMNYIYKKAFMLLQVTVTFIEIPDILYIFLVTSVSTSLTKVPALTDKMKLFLFSPGAKVAD